MRQDASLWRRFFRAETGIFLGVWLALMVLGRSSLLRDPGTFWHVRLGQQMLDSGSVVRSDTLSFTRFGQPWVAQQWLAECGMAAIHRAGGLDGLLLATATLLAGLTTWIGWRLLRAGFHILPVGALLALVLMTGAPQFHARPLILTFGLLGLEFALLVDVEAGRRSLRWLWWLVPLTALWANLHGGVMAGLGTLGLALAGWAAAWAFGGDSPVRRPRDLAAVVALLAACTGSVLLNPYGTDLPRAWLATLAIPLPELIQEHRPLDFVSPLGWAVVLLGLGYLVALAGCWSGSRSRKGTTAGLSSSVRRHGRARRGHGTRSSDLPQWRRLLQRAAVWPRVTWLIPLVWLVLAVMRVRNVPLFAVVAALAAAEALPRGRWAAWLRRHEMLVDVDQREQTTGRCGRSMVAAVLPVLVVVVAVVLQVAGVRVAVIGRGWARLDPAHWPVALLPQLEEIDRTEPKAAPIFNDLAFGGLLIYYAPRVRVFVDDRCALYGAEFLEAYNHARTSDPAQIDRWQQQYGFRYTLVEAGMPFDRYLNESGQWQLVGRTRAAALYLYELGQTGPIGYNGARPYDQMTSAR